MKQAAITCDQCGQPCGGPKHNWHYYTVQTVMAEMTEFVPVVILNGDFCSPNCLLRALLECAAFEVPNG